MKRKKNERTEREKGMKEGREGEMEGQCNDAMPNDD